MTAKHNVNWLSIFYSTCLIEFKQQEFSLQYHQFRRATALTITPIELVIITVHKIFHRLLMPPLFLRLTRSRQPGGKAKDLRHILIRNSLSQMKIPQGLHNQEQTVSCNLDQCLACNICPSIRRHRMAKSHLILILYCL